MLTYMYMYIVRYNGVLLTHLVQAENSCWMNDLTWLQQNSRHLRQSNVVCAISLHSLNFCIKGLVTVLIICVVYHHISFVQVRIDENCLEKNIGILTLWKYVICVCSHVEDINYGIRDVVRLNKNTQDLFNIPYME